MNAARPVVVNDTIFLSAAYDVGAAMLKVEPDSKSVKEIWVSSDAMENHWSTSIAVDGYLYGFSGRHEVGSSFRCIRASNGALQWETSEDGLTGEPDPKDGRGGGEPKYFGRGSCILADGKFIVLGERGVLALVECNPKEYKEISRVKYSQMGYPSWAAPILSRGRLYLRDENTLMCIDLRKQPAKPSTATSK